VYVRDLASTNGVERNGVPVQEPALSDDDILRIGSYTFRCDSGFSYEETQDTLPAAELVGDNVKFSFPADQQTVLIGRRQGCDLLIDEEGVAPVMPSHFSSTASATCATSATPGERESMGNGSTRKPCAR
jgi:pSer/pThr/pTyr-binding forkhead associated (FHA) protein